MSQSWDNVDNVILSRVKYELSVQSRVPVSTVHDCIDENNLLDVMDEVISILIKPWSSAKATAW